MTTLVRRWLDGLGRLFRPRRVDDDLDRELSAYLDAAIEQNVASGMTASDAVRTARIEMGSLAAVKDHVRDVSWDASLRALGRDIRTAGRSLRRTPGLTVVAVLTLMLGIGANTALFSIFNSLLMKPLPVKDPERLVYLSEGSWTYPIWEQIRLRAPELFEDAFAWSNQTFDLADGGEVEPVDGAYVSGRTFAVLGIHAVRGRSLGEGDDQRRGAHSTVAVISHRLWQQRYGGAGDVIGRTITLQRVPFTIVGVMPAGFFGPEVGRAWNIVIPFGAEPLITGNESSLDRRSTWWLDIMVRTKPGQTVDTANALLRGVQPQIRESTAPPRQDDFRELFLREPFTLLPAATGLSPLRDRFRVPLIALVGAVGLVLLIGCANLAHLTLARGLSRQRELSIRLALGATRGRLVRLLLVESALLAAAGTALGLVFAQWAGGLLIGQFSTWRETVSLDLAADWRVLVFATGLTVLTTVLAGLAPALASTRIGISDVLKDAARSVAGDPRHRLRNWLVVLQIALSLVVIVGAGLFLRTFVALARVPLGFSPDPLTVIELNLQPSRIPADQRVSLMERFREAAVRVPGVTVAAVSLMTPLSGSVWTSGVGEMQVPDRSKMTWRNGISPGWFDAYGIRLLAGRDFTGFDRLGQEPVAIVNQAFVTRFLSGQPAVGQVVRLGGPGGRTSAYTVVGLVSDAVYRNPRDGFAPTMYVPVSQQARIGPTVALTIAVASGDRAAVERAVSSALHAVDPTTAFAVRRFDQLRRATVVQERLVALLSTFFGALALLLAGIGLYGVVSHAVGSQRTEIGVRIALGANRADIVVMVLKRVASILTVGVVAGAAISVWLSRFVATMLFEIQARDLSTFVGGAGVLVATALLAAWLPARRASLTDPAVALREG
ncbi:MAG: ABC transporter permease [Acidobacteria bacterium]|nr:ABC transporter permease [Acidobacteriota bacterium]